MDSLAFLPYFNCITDASSAKAIVGLKSSHADALRKVGEDLIRLQTKGEGALNDALGERKGKVQMILQELAFENFEMPEEESEEEPSSEDVENFTHGVLQIIGDLPESFDVDITGMTNDEITAAADRSVVLTFVRSFWETVSPLVLVKKPEVVLVASIALSTAVLRRVQKKEEPMSVSKVIAAWETIGANIGKGF